MHGQGNYTSPNGQGPYAPQSVFRQRPGASTFPHGPLAQQPQFINQGCPSFHPTPGVSVYQHSQANAPNRGPPAPVSSSEMSSAQPYPNNARNPALHLRTQTSHSYQTSEQRSQPWSQNVHPFPPSAYSLLSSQGHTIERVPPRPLPPPPPPPMLPYSSGSRSLTSYSFGASMLPLRQHPYRHVMGPLPPPPASPVPPPPPPSPPGVPPLPVASPPSDNLLNSGGICNMNENSLNGNNVMLECPSLLKPAGDEIVHKVEVLCQETEKNGPTVQAVGVVLAHLPADSDMDMEDDITQPDEEKHISFSTNLNNDRVSLSQEDYAKEQQNVLQHTGEDTVLKVALDGNLLSAESSVLEDQTGGSEGQSNYDIPVSRKLCSEAVKSGQADNGQNEHSLDACEKESLARHESFNQPNVQVVSAGTGCENLSGQLMENSNPFKLLQGYASDNTSDNDGEKLLGDVSAQSVKVGPTDFASGGIEESSDKGHRNQGSVAIDDQLEVQPKDSKRHDNAKIGLDGANFQDIDMKCNSTTLNVDEFGRLVREGVSDGDSSGSPRYTRRHARRARRRSRSQSRSSSPRDRRARRSPRRRKERRARSRSLSPRRRRSRTRSPVSKRGNEFVSDKLRREKGPLPECFDFLRGKCYRGANCRYSHHETDKSERSRYSRGKQESRDKPHRSQSSDRILLDKDGKDQKVRLPQDMPSLKEVKDEKPLVDPNTLEKPNFLESASLQDVVIASNRSSQSAYDMPSGNENYSKRDSAAKFSVRLPQFCDQLGIRVGNSLVSESPDKLEAKQGPAGPLHCVGSPITKSRPTKEIPSRSLEELFPSVTNHPSHLSLPLPTVSQVTSVPFTQSMKQGYNSMPHITQFYPTPGHYSSYQAPASYQQLHFPGPPSSLRGSLLPPPPEPQSHSAIPTTVEHRIPSQHVQQSLLSSGNISTFYTSMGAHPTDLPNQSQTGHYQEYPPPGEPDKKPNSSDDYRSSSFHVTNLSSEPSGNHVMGFAHKAGNSEQRMNPLQSSLQAQPNSLPVLSPLKAMSLGGSFPLDSSSSYNHPYFQQVPYGLQYSTADSVSVQPTELGNVSSSISRITPDFLERSQHVHDFVGSRISTYFNPYASTFDRPLSSKISSNALTKENDTPMDSRYGGSYGLSSVPVDGQKTGCVDLKNVISSSTPTWHAGSVLPERGADQYDPLFDSIDPVSDSLSRADHQKHEIVGDSDNIPSSILAGRVFNMEDIKQEGDTAVSANDSAENEEYGETADAEVDAVLSGSPRSPNDAVDTNAGEIEIDQVKSSKKKKKGKDSRSMKLFKVSVATFVKEVLKPSWRQGNMSKEAFKTIVKKTVDKVSGAMKSHHIPKSQAKINHYIDSSRGKLTKLVMGYVDKYVKV